MAAPAKSSANPGIDKTWLTKFIRDQLTQTPLPPQSALKTDNHEVNNLKVNSSVTLDGVQQPKITTSSFSLGPPPAPSDGDIWIATGVDSDGTRWQFSYDISDTTYPWKFIGGPTTRWNVANWGTVTADSTWRAITGSITLARAGEYLFSGQFSVSPTTYGAFHQLGFSGTGGVTQVANAQDHDSSAQNTWMHISSVPWPIVSSAGQAWTLMTWINGSGSPQYDYTNLSITPIRIA